MGNHKGYNRRRLMGILALAYLTQLVVKTFYWGLYGPEIVSRGFVFEGETGYLVEDAQCVVLEVVEEINPELENRVEKIRQEVQKALRQYFFFTIGRRPVILPFIIEI